MSPWRAEAFARFPELAERFRDSEEDGDEGSPYAVWHLLWEAFAEAYKTPRDDGMIRRVYEYCDWCLELPPETSADDDLGSCIATCFFESIPTVPEAVDDMPRWWTRDEVVRTREIFSYLVGEEGFSRILARFDRAPGDVREDNAG